MNNKRKVLVIALALCLIGVLSLGTLAWFSAEDEVTNEFFIANSEDDPDKIFSVDVWEDKTIQDVDGEEKIQDGIVYTPILPGDIYTKEVHIENTGSYPQYVRATVTVSDASVWQDVYGKYLVPLADFVEGIDENAIHTMVAYYDAVEDTFVYELYFTDAIDAGEEIIVFNKVMINENMDRYQAAELGGDFYINIVADAVQTENVGDNVYAAFETVGLVTVEAGIAAGDLSDALQSEEPARIVLDPSVDWNANPLKIDADISNKTIDFNGQDGAIEFGAGVKAENVVITGIVDTDGTARSVATASDFTGDVTVIGCSFMDANGNPLGAVSPAGGNVTIDNCEFVGLNKSYGIYHSGAMNGSLTIKNSTFKNLGSWAIMINNKITGDLTVDNCVFETKDGILKVLYGVEGDITVTNNTLIGVKGHDGNPNQIVSGMTSNSGVVTFAGNTLDGVDWAP